MDDHQWALETLAIRAGYEQTEQQENSEAIFPTSSFRYESAQQAADRFSGEEAGNVYSRFTNPTVQAFERRLAAMEEGEACVATASGMSAILTSMIGLLQAGDHLVCSQNVFGTTRVLFDQYLRKFGVAISFVPLTDLAAWEDAIQPNTRLLFLETPSNPLSEVADMARLSELAKRHQAWLMVDNCFCTPALQRPLALGADLVIHSATKFLDGQGRAVGGAVVGPADLIEEKIRGVMRTAGPSMSPFNAWIFLKGLETLALRMEAHSRQAQSLAEWLAVHPAVERVYFPGLADHPQRALIERQQAGPGGLLAFEVKGGQAEAWSVIDQTRLISITANLGDVKTSITHPATTTHARVPEAEREASGITMALLRVSVGLETIDDLKADLARGLDAIA
ncbi:O-succinylhomoserine sulfhydrylase [Thiomicrospira sp. WB1]|uniref:O-succinylhomoserine sulfhydrylase n=1 Tax=Thiomicrospira sp. WB1 TaxID=1685380 RepID=UPI00074A4FD8|nr:O-succinylhomoserine sulfhydrylase [Thiomicrospira sp. WB1]KUJ71827.1 O-succinylhomoserine sulfhydrylase [Thiomicrospira sp. WB1]